MTVHMYNVQHHGHHMMMMMIIIMMIHCHMMMIIMIMVHCHCSGLRLFKFTVTTVPVVTVPASRFYITYVVT